MPKPFLYKNGSDTILIIIFNSISTFIGYLMPKLSILKDSRGAI